MPTPPRSTTPGRASGATAILESPWSRRAFLAGGLASLWACSRGGGKGVTTPTSLALRPVFTAPGGERGFFSLHPVSGGLLLAGTYGTPRGFASSDGESWTDVSGALTGAGESLFDIVDSAAGIYGVTESTGGLYRFVGSTWRRVFSASDFEPGAWNNGYGIAEWNGKVVTGFNEYPASTRTLIVIGVEGNWETHVLDGYDHFRPGVLGGTLYGGAGVSDTRQDIAFLRYEGGGVWTEVARVGGYSYSLKMRAIGGDLYVGLEPAAIARFTGSSVRSVVRVPGYQICPQVIEHEGGIYAAVSQPWRASGGRGAVVNGSTGAVLAEVAEPECWCLASFNGGLFVGSRSDGPKGRIYRTDAGAHHAQVI